MSEDPKEDSWISLEARPFQQKSRTKGGQATRAGSPEHQSAPFSDFDAGSPKEWCRSADKRERGDVGRAERGARRLSKRDLGSNYDGKYSEGFDSETKVGSGWRPLDTAGGLEECADPPLSPLRDRYTVPQAPSEGDIWTLPLDVRRRLLESPEPLALIYQVTATLLFPFNAFFSLLIFCS